MPQQLDLVRNKSEQQIVLTQSTQRKPLKDISNRQDTHFTQNSRVHKLTNGHNSNYYFETEPTAQNISIRNQMQETKN